MKARKVQHAGCFFVASPIYVPIDLDLIKRIMTADFTHFTDHRIYVNDEDDPLSAHLFALSGRRWRDLRVKLTPTYTSGRMKLMFPVMVAISHELIATLKEEHQKGPVDITNICTRFSTDIVGNCTLGIDCNSLKDPYSEFCVKGKRLFNVTRLEIVVIFLCLSFPKAMKFLRSRFLPKEATDFFWKVTKDATNYRENTKVRRDDVLQLLIDLMHKEDEENGTSLTFNELAAQVLIFFVAGFATSSILMYFALFELSLNEDIQDQLRRETHEVLRDNNGEITYESLRRMNYLDMIINAEFYSTMKARNVQHAGCFFVASPIYVPIDLDLIKRIMTTDFTYFTDHRIYVNDEDDPLSAHLFALSGQRWRDLRVKLAPTYTSGRMKSMFPVMVAISHELIATLKEEHQKGPVDITDICTRFSTDIVGNCTLGVDCNSLKYGNSEFCVKGKRLFTVTRFEIVVIFLCLSFPKAMKFLGSRFLPKDATDFFWKITKDATDYRENNKVRRDDVLQLLIDLMHKEDVANGTTITFNELAAQVLIFFVAGFATSSILMYFALFELSLNEDIQDQLRREVQDDLRNNNGEITYESLHRMKYLDMIINEPTIPFGNFKDNFALKSTFGDCFADFYSTVKERQVQYAGCFLLTAPIFVPIDLDLIKRVMTTDFAYFTDHRTYVNEKDDPLSAHIFALGGQRWRDLRVKLTPTFTSGKMKLMFPIMIKISLELIATLNDEYPKGPVDAKDVSARFTTDVIGNCAFGIECNSLKNPNTEFRVKGKRLLNLSRFENMLLFLSMTFPNVMRFLKTPFFPKEATQFFWDVAKDSTHYRQKNGIRRNDALQMLIDMLRKDGDKSDSGLTFNELAAQVFVFFVAGFETSSTLMSFALFELAVNEDIQNQLRVEINEILRNNNHEITYDSLSQMPFLDMVLNETLRKYPPLPVLTRVCTKDYQVPNSNVILRKGDELFISMKGIHYDPEYYPDPEKFDPLRFSEENKSQRHQFTFLPFGEGPRICIGTRFGLMQAKVGLSSLIANFKFKLNPRTEMPLKLDPRNFLTTALGGLWMDIERINC
ncbi:hypothetical protein Trydic_g6882 [Trypoxylus dichotomus]